MVANELCEYLEQQSAIRLKYNDIDVYHGSFGDGEINRIDCKWTKIEGINPEVNLISCTKLNTSSLIGNFDINAVAVCVHVILGNDEIPEAN